MAVFQNATHRAGWRTFIGPLLIYAATTLVCLAGTHTCEVVAVRVAGSAPRPSGPGPSFGNDGGFYLQIAEDGYSYEPFRQSNVAFFPAYPLLGRSTAAALGIRTDIALLIVAHAALAAGSVVLAKYLEIGPFPRLGVPTLLLLLLWPTSFFFRMAYSESLLFLLMVLAMYGMRAGWPRLLVAVIIGAATAARPVGLALVAPFLWTLWSDWKEREKAPSPGQRGQRGPAPLVQAAALVAISVWGLAAFMAWQGATFGDPLAFVRAQNYWAVRQANTALRELSSLASLSAMADVYVPDSPVYWRRFDSDLPAWLSLQFANPIYFAAAVALSLWGWFRGWLDDREALLATFLLLIPYVTHGFECGLAGHGRYATVAFPAHLALARALQSAAPLARWALYGVFTGLLFAYSALFACGYRLV